MTDKVVIHREDFSQVLAKEYHLSGQTKKNVLIPIGIEMRDDGIDQDEAKNRLGLEGKRILLFFGNLTGYKGLELLIDSMRLLDQIYEDLFLIIAGGDTPGLRVAGEKAYSEILKERARNGSSNIQFTSFVEENDVGVYFSAADLVVLPYTIGLSSSGPLAVAVAYNRPFIVSTALKGVIALDAAIFEPNVQSLVEKIDRFFKDDDLRHEIIDYQFKLKTERSWSQVGEQTKKLYGEYL